MHCHSLIWEMPLWHLVLLWLSLSKFPYSCHLKIYNLTPTKPSDWTSGTVKIWHFGRCHVTVLSIIGILTVFTFIWQMSLAKLATSLDICYLVNYWHFYGCHFDIWQLTFPLIQKFKQSVSLKTPFICTLKNWLPLESDSQFDSIWLSIIWFGESWYYHLLLTFDRKVINY